jgi:hypothetical protein
MMWVRTCRLCLFAMTPWGAIGCVQQMHTERMPGEWIVKSAPNGDVEVRVRCSRHAELGAEKGLLGTVLKHDAVDRVLVSTSGVAGSGTDKWAAYATRDARGIDLPGGDGSWLASGPIVYLADGIQTNAGAAFAHKGGPLVRIFWEDERHMLGVRLSGAPPLPGTWVWSCRPELGSLLNRALFPVEAYLVGDPGGVLGEVVARDDDLVQIERLPSLGSDAVRIEWELLGDARVPWESETVLAPRAWSALGERDYGPFSPDTKDDAFLAVAAIVARRLVLTNESEAFVSVSSGGRPVLERRISNASMFTVACALRQIFALVRSEEPEKRVFRCVVHAREPR